MKVTTGQHYLAFVLSDECRKEVASLYRRRHEVLVCHHVTLCFNITEDDVERLQQLVDSNPVFALNCFIESDTIDFFRVLVNGKLMPTDQSFTHLTFSRKASAKNQDSNKVFKGELDHTGVLSAGGKLEGRFELVPY